MSKKSCKNCSECVKVFLSYHLDGIIYKKLSSKYFCLVHKLFLPTNEFLCNGEGYVKGSYIEMKLELPVEKVKVEHKRYCPVCEKWFKFKGGKYLKVCSDECKKEWNTILKAKRLLHDLRSE